MKFLFGDLNLIPHTKTDTQEVVLYDEEKNVVFDLTSFLLTSAFIKLLHGIPENKSKLAKKSRSLLKAIIETEIANRPSIMKEREQDRLSGKTGNQFNKLMTKLSVASRFERSELSKLKLYEFYETLHEVIGYTYWQFRMNSYFSGNIDTKKVNKKELEWFYD
jgi:hypothetical protein